jgi:hypothetical protein
MANVYVDHKDTVILDLVNEAIGRLKNARGPKSLGYRDNTKPALDYSPGTPATIKKAMPQRIRIASPK